MPAQVLAVHRLLDDATFHHACAVVPEQVEEFLTPLINGERVNGEPLSTEV